MTRRAPVDRPLLVTARVVPSRLTRPSTWSLPPLSMHGASKRTIDQEAPRQTGGEGEEAEVLELDAIGHRYFSLRRRPRCAGECQLPG